MPALPVSLAAPALLAAPAVSTALAASAAISEHVSARCRLSEADELRALQQSGEVPDALRSADAVRRIGDAEAPNTIAAAVYAGYRAGVELGQTVDLAERFGRRDIRIPA